MQNKEIVKIESVRKQKSPIIFILSSILIVILLITSCIFLNKKINNVDYKNVKIGSENFRLEVANTDAAREKGLSRRDSLAKNNGMLFDFKAYGDWRMWMVDMHFDIDMIWLNQQGKILHTKTNATSGSFPEVYHAEQQNWYVIELPAGTSDRLGIKEGDTIKIN